VRKHCGDGGQGFPLPARAPDHGFRAWGLFGSTDFASSRFRSLGRQTSEKVLRTPRWLDSYPQVSSGRLADKGAPRVGP
jgi:hypothetical protein